MSDQTATASTGNTNAPQIELDLAIKFSVKLPIIGHIDIANITHNTKTKLPVTGATAELINADLPAEGMVVTSFATNGVSVTVRLDPGVAAA